MSEKLQKDLESLQQDLQRLIKLRQSQELQRQELLIVQDGFDNLKETDQIYSKIGPALVPQDKQEALSTVRDRLNYINTSIKKVEADIETCKKKLISTRTELINSMNQGPVAAN